MNTCTQQDIDDTGYPSSVYRRLVIDASGFNPNSTVQCGYQYSEPRGGSWYEESFTVDSDGAARHRFPHRVDVGRVPPSYSITSAASPSPDAPVLHGSGGRAGGGGPVRPSGLVPTSETSGMDARSARQG